MLLIELIPTKISTKIYKNVIRLLEKDLLFLKFNGSTILDFGTNFPKNYSNLLII